MITLSWLSEKTGAVVLLSLFGIFSDVSLYPTLCIEARFAFYMRLPGSKVHLPSSPDIKLFAWCLM